VTENGQPEYAFAVFQGVSAVRHSRNGFLAGLGIFLLSQTPALAKAPLTIVCLGDSVTRGIRSGVKAEETYCAVLEKDLIRAGIVAKVINAGIGGHTTGDGLKRFAKDVLAHQPRLVVIMFGLNDCWIDKGKTKARFTVQEYTANLRKMINILRKKKIATLLLTPNPVIAPQYPPRINAHLKQYVTAVRNLAREENLRLVDVYAAFAELGLEGVKLKDLFTDAMHPNPRGHEIIAGLAAREIKQMLGK
jgi:lysophospholipase L1-like esterase